MANKCSRLFINLIHFKRLRGSFAVLKPQIHEQTTNLATAVSIPIKAQFVLVCLIGSNFTLREKYYRKALECVAFLYGKEHVNL